MIASPPIDTAVDWPSPAAVSVLEISVVIPPLRDITPTEPGRVGLGRVLRGAADAAHLDHVGNDHAEAVGADDARALRVRELDHLGDVAARDPLRDDHDQLDAVLERLEHRVLGEGGGDGHDRAVDRRAVVLDRLLDGVEHRHAVHVAALAARASRRRRPSRPCRSRGTRASGSRPRAR